MEPRRHVDPQLGFDEWVFGGTAPTVSSNASSGTRRNPALVRLRRLARVPQPLRGDARPSRSCCGWPHYPRFRRFRALILTVTFAGFLPTSLYPAIPPWLASERGDMPDTVRVVREVWLGLGLDNIAAVFGEKSNYAFPVGALPSLHAAWPFMIMLFFWSAPGAGGSCSSCTRSRWRSRSSTPPTTSCSTSCSAGPTPRRLRRRLAGSGSGAERSKPIGVSPSDAKTRVGHPSMRRPLR